jgi:hypothetical protein
MIRRQLQKIIRWAMNYESSVCEKPLSTFGLNGKGMNFSIYSASGGHVMEYRMYDEKTDKMINNLHIITSDQDMGERIGLIVTTEILRNH